MDAKFTALPYSNETARNDLLMPTNANESLTQR